MAVGSVELPLMSAVAGIRWGGAAAGIKRQGRKDVAVMEIAAGSSVAAVYTLNAFCAAPVIVAKRHGAATAPRYLLINSGNANAGTGEPGMRAAEASCAAVAAVMGCKAEEVLPFSTGVIGELLPVAKIEAVLPQAKESLTADGWADAARSIMTTDTVPKGATRQIVVQGKTITINGISKGSGMICPNMATMLGYVATDAGVDQALLLQLMTQAANLSFNCITVDGDTSTNDACVLVATNKAGVSFNSASDVGYTEFAAAVIEVCQVLAQAIIRDGEGATKYITVDVRGGINEAECRQVAYTIAHSPLVKTAFFASDPNWGRILAAVGRAGVEGLDVEKIDIYLGEVCIVRGGGRDPVYTEEAGQRVMKEAEITICVELARGGAEAQIWTTDFSYDYVKINAEYRS